MDELRLAKEKIKELEEKQKKDEKTVKSQFEHMMRLQERCKDLKSQVTTGVVKHKPIPGIEDKDKTIDDLRDKLLQAEKNREIIQQSRDSEAKAARLIKGKLDAQIKELNIKIEKLEQELREKTQETRIASTKIREL